MIVMENPSNGKRASSSLLGASTFVEEHALSQKQKIGC